MIVALEGPDCSGKTTLWNALKACVVDARFIPKLSISKELLPHMKLVQQREAEMWESLYQRNTLYICDRHFAVSAPVYDQLYGRERVDYSKWYHEVRVVFLATPLDELERRFAQRGDESIDMEQLKTLNNLYWRHVDNFKHIRLTPAPVEEQVDAVRRWLRT